MARGKLILENKEGKQKRTPLGYSYLMLLLGPFFSMFRGQMGHAWLGFVLLIPTLGISWLTYPAVINIFYRRKLLSEGYRIVGLEGITANELERRTGINIDTGEIPKQSQKTLLFAFVQLIPISFWVVSIGYNEIRLKQLRTSDPTAYLDEIKFSEKYWDELKELDPERYQREWSAELQKRREEEKRYSAVMDEFFEELATMGAIYSEQLPAYDPLYTQLDYQNLVQSIQYASTLEGPEARLLFLYSGVSSFDSDCDRYVSSYSGLSAEQKASLHVAIGKKGDDYASWLDRNRSQFSIQLRNMIVTRTMTNGDKAGRNVAEMSGACSEFNDAILWWHSDEIAD